MSAGLSRAEIGRRLRAARRSVGLTQAAVAAHMGWSRPTVSAIEAGQRAVRSEELFALANLYVEPVHQLLRPLTAEAATNRTVAIGGG